MPTPAGTSEPGPDWIIGGDAPPGPGSQPRELLRVEDAAARLAIGRTTMFALLRDGSVESVKLGRLRFVPVDAITVYVADLTIGQRSDAA